MDARYLAAIFDENLNIYVSRPRLSVYVEGYVRNRGLAMTLRDDLGCYIKRANTTQSGDIVTSYQISFRSKKSLLKLCNAIHPHTIKQPVVNALRDAVHNLYHNRDKEDRKFWLRRLWRVQQKWVEDC